MYTFCTVNENLVGNAMLFMLVRVKQVCKWILQVGPPGIFLFGPDGGPGDRGGLSAQL